MKKVAVLSGLASNGGSTDYAGHFSESIKGYEFVDINFDHLVIEIAPGKFDITDGRSDQNINQFDLVIIREYKGRFVDLAYVVSKYLEASDVRFLNQNYLVYRPLSKIAQAVVFYEQKVRFPATVLSLNPDYLEKKLRTLGYPLILKDTLGMHGSDNFLVDSLEDVRQIYQRHPMKAFVAQEYVPNSHDYRVLVMGDLEPLQIKRTAADGSHLNNTSQGGSGALVKELPPQILDKAQQLCKLLNLTIGGVDVLQSSQNGHYYFLEINNQPQLVTGVELAGKMSAFQKFLDSLFA